MNNNNHKRPADIMANRITRNFQKDFFVIGKGRITSWPAWLIIGVITGVVIGLISVATRTGEFEKIEAVSFAGGQGQQVGASPSPEQSVLVKFRPSVSAEDRSKAHAQNGGKVTNVIPGIDVDVVAVAEGRGAASEKAYKEDSRVLYAEVDGQAHATDVPNDPYYNNQWNMTKVSAPSAWDITKGAPTITIAILDTGIELAHPDLSGKVVASVNYSTSPTASDVQGHGTHVAGIAAAATNNAQGVAGLGYNATILNVKVLGDAGSGDYSWVAMGIIWAADNGAKVINMSLGGTIPSLTLQDAVNYAWSKGAIIVAAAGNNGSTAPFYPAYYTNVIAVAATDHIDQVPVWSNRGDWVDVAAPGVIIYSTMKNNSYGTMSGTSMATPHVAGLAALVLDRTTDANGNGLLNDEVRTCIQNNADNIGVSGIGSGRINAYKAVQCSPAATGAMAGKVTDSSKGTAIAGATVSDGVRTASTDASGVYAIASVPPGAYAVTASASGYNIASQSVSVTAGLTSTANFALSPTTDTTPPSTSIISPLNGATVSGTITVTANAEDNIGVTNVELFLDGAVAGADATFPYEFIWDTTQSPNGSHTLQSKAYDAAGNSGSSSIVTVTVNNTVSDTVPPSVSITFPLNNSTVATKSTVSIGANATDNVGVFKVEFYVNAFLKCTDAAAPYSCSWKVPGAFGKTYQLQSKAYDTSNNIGSSAVVTVKSQ